MRRRPIPSARSAAISPSRWLIETVSSVATRRNANDIVSDESTNEICLKYAKPLRLNCATTSSFEYTRRSGRSPAMARAAAAPPPDSARDATRIKSASR